METLPDSCDIAFKEWAGVCRALREGRQTIIVRKGGISEGQNGFLPEYSAFWLFPTYVHQAQQGLREDEWQEPDASRSPEAPVTIRSLAKVESIDRLESPDLLDALSPFHVWTEETLLKRFHYRTPGLWVLGVRIFDADRGSTVTPTVDQLGCKSWVPLSSPLSTDHLQPVLDPSEWERRNRLLREAIGNDR